MKTTNLVVAAALAVAGTCNLALAHDDEGHVHAGSVAVKAGAKAAATLEARSGSSVKGRAAFVAKRGKVTMEIEIEGLTPGPHAVHLHEKGDCSAPDATSAGGHWNPTGEDHGKWGTVPYHHGDIGNLVAGPNGKGKLFFSTDMWSIGGDPAHDVVGHAVIVHAGVDDFKTQPTGNAGGRVACGVIELEKP